MVIKSLECCSCVCRYTFSWQMVRRPENSHKKLVMLDSFWRIVQNFVLFVVLMSACDDRTLFSGSLSVNATKWRNMAKEVDDIGN